MPRQVVSSSIDFHHVPPEPPNSLILHKVADAAYQTKWADLNNDSHN